MKIEQIINDILELRKELQRKAQTYLYDIDYISIFDNQLNAKAKALQAYLKFNNFTEYYNLLELLIPIKNNAIEFVETFISIKDEILEYSKYNNPQSRLKLINDLAYHMQEIYVRTEIDCIFASLNIKCGDEYYTFNSKRIYVQNVLQNATTMQLIKLAKSENLLMETIDLKEEISEISNNFINEQIEKCNKKIANGDYDGAITNARSLLEEVLLIIEKKICGVKSDYDGDLLKLYKRVRKILNLEPDDNNIENSLNEITRGLTSVISGLSSISNNLSDRHARKYKPDKRHSILCVNSSFIICKFLFDSYKFQYKNI
jgi:hypothetical protein